MLRVGLPQAIVTSGIVFLSCGLWLLPKVNDTLIGGTPRVRGWETRAMTPDRDFSPKPQSQALPQPHSLPLEEDAGPATLFQEINERRARIENAELLRHLRGL